MDGSRFDRLVNVLASRQPRRATLALFALVGLALPDRQAEGGDRVRRRADRNRGPDLVLCRPSGIKCRLKKSKGVKPSSLCKNCCETFQKRGKKTGRCCTANGRPCASAAECCLGECTVGTCQNTTLQIPLHTPCTTYNDCNPGVQVGDTNSGPRLDKECASIQAQKGQTSCGPASSGGVTVCCRPFYGICADDCECCGDLRCRNGSCAAPPPCHQRGEACTDGEPCCAGAGTCTGGICCLADGDKCPCGEPGNCQGCCSGACGAQGQCGTCTPYGQPCTGPDQCCFYLDGTRIPCSGGICRDD